MGLLLKNAFLPLEFHPFEVEFDKLIHHLWPATTSGYSHPLER